jgi:hypothetical protein
MDILQTFLKDSSTIFPLDVQMMQKSFKTFQTKQKIYIHFSEIKISLSQNIIKHNIFKTFNNFNSKPFSGSSLWKKNQMFQHRILMNRISRFIKFI